VFVDQSEECIGTVLTPAEDAKGWQNIFIPSQGGAVMEIRDTAHHD
jgi:hypothetical protein